MRIRDKNVLVTGGAGFIGSHLAEHLTERNFVRLLDDFSTGCWENIATFAGQGNVQVVEGDVTDEQTVRSACADVDVVFHLAVSCLRTSLADPMASHNVNAGGTLHLCRAAQACGVERFVYISSSEVYGTACETPMAETHRLEPMTVYGAAKLAGELYAKAFHRTYGLPTVIVRPFNTYGPREPWRGTRAEVIPRFILQTLSDKAPVIFGDGTQSRDFTYVDDTVIGILLAAECDALVGDVVNIARGEEVSIARVASMVTEQVGGAVSSLAPSFAPRRPGDVMRHWADCSKARRLLGFQARTGFREGLRRSIEWFREHAADTLLANAHAGEANW